VARHLLADGDVELRDSEVSAVLVALAVGVLFVRRVQDEIAFTLAGAFGVRRRDGERLEIAGGELLDLAGGGMKALRRNSRAHRHEGGEHGGDEKAMRGGHFALLDADEETLGAHKWIARE